MLHCMASGPVLAWMQSVSTQLVTFLPASWSYTMPVHLDGRAGVRLSRHESQVPKALLYYSQALLEM